MTKFTRVPKMISAFSLLGMICFTSLFPSCNVSTASLSDVKLCSNLSGTNCAEDLTAFAPDVQAINCTANLKNAPSKTKVTFNWKKDGEAIGNAEVEAETGYVSSTFRPSEPLPSGKYSVTVKIETDNSQPVTKDFTVE